MADSLTESTAEIKGRSRSVNFFRRLIKEKPLGTVGGFIILALLFIGIFADFVAPYGMNEVWVAEFLEPPRPGLWMGSDNLGRDILSRVIYGARVSVIVGLAASTLATVLSLIIGMVSAYVGGKFDLLIQRIVDGSMCIPQLILQMVIISILGRGMWPIIVTLGLMWGVIGSRIIRSAVIGIKENPYIEAAVAIGCPTGRILIRHILPNIMAATIILFTTRVPNVILVEASLSFLGFGIPPPTPSWGGMLSGLARPYMLKAPWMAVFPGLALAVVVYGINIFGDAVRDLLDPRLRGGVGRYGVTTDKIKNKEVST